YVNKANIVSASPELNKKEVVVNNKSNRETLFKVDGRVQEENALILPLILH
ncbi:684_t:CDS:1, partial [Dentiscutata erythropus]